MSAGLWDQLSLGAALGGHGPVIHPISVFTLAPTYKPPSLQSRTILHAWFRGLRSVFPLRDHSPQFLGGETDMQRDKAACPRGRGRGRATEKAPASHVLLRVP